MLDELVWLLARSFNYLPRKGDYQDKEFTIGITTFLDRYENCLKPLVKKISYLYPECRIIVVANGHVRRDEHLLYLDSINNFCKGFHNVDLITFIEPRGLSFIWNRIIEQSETRSILILNDDLKIKFGFRKFMYKSGILESGIAVINRSWSHFVITKEVFETVGSFDENLLEIGGEDDDYMARMALRGITLSYFTTPAIAAKLKLMDKRLKQNSYGKDMNNERHGYSSYNTNYLESKWIMSNTKFEGSTEVHEREMKYWKLRKGYQNQE